MKSTLLAGLGLLCIGGAACDNEKNADLPQVWFTAGTFTETDTAPAVLEDRLFVDNGRTLHAFANDDGHVLWVQSITVGNKRVFASDGQVFASGYKVHAFDADSGNPLWTYQNVTDTTVYTEGDADDGRVFVGSPYSGAVLALDAKTGTLLWRSVVQQPGWAFRAGVRAVREHEGVVYALANRPYARNGYIQAMVIVAYDAATGRELWRYQKGDETTAYLVGGSLSFYGDLVLYGDMAMREVGAVSRVTHREAWVFTTPWELAGPAQAPTIDGERAYVGNGDGNVYALEAATGKLIWRTPKAEGSYASQAVCGAYVSASFSTTRIFDKATGRRIGQLIPLSLFQRSRVATDGRRFYLATNNGVYAFDCTR